MSDFSRKFPERVRVAYNVVALTGAGMSADSGVPTFRGKDGLWNKYDPHELATDKAFRANPERVWEWYTWRRKLIADCEPHLGHYALVDLAARFPDFRIVTQNVDGLHQRAGSLNVIELHGSIHKHHCIDCKTPMSEADLQAHIQREGEKKVPTCSTCGSLMRPGVVWFGEPLPPEAIEKAQSLSAAAEIFFSIGTSSSVEPAASLPYLAKGNGAMLVEVNPNRTPLSDVVDARFSASVSETLPKLAMLIEKVRRGLSATELRPFAAG